MAELNKIQKAGLGIMVTSVIGLWGIAQYALKKWSKFESACIALKAHKEIAQINADFALLILKKYGVYDIEGLKKAGAREGEIQMAKLFFDWVKGKL